MDSRLRGNDRRNPGFLLSVPGSALRYVSQE